MLTRLKKFLENRKKKKLEKENAKYSNPFTTKLDASKAAAGTSDIRNTSETVSTDNLGSFSGFSYSTNSNSVVEEGSRLTNVESVPTVYSNEERNSLLSDTSSSSSSSYDSGVSSSSYDSGCSSSYSDYSSSSSYDSGSSSSFSSGD